MFRTLVVGRGEKVSVKDRWLVVTIQGGEQRVPIDDVYSLVIDNQQTTLTTYALTALTHAGVHVLLCDEKHMPVSVLYPLNTHYRPWNVMKRQLNMPQEFKDEIWKGIIKGKLYNQAKVLELCHVKTEKVERLLQLREEVVAGDEGNREGIGAKWFFRSLYGADFIRMHDDGINAALNYGYAILRSAVGKTLTAYGYNCTMGVHHINEANPFNLADDLMEPLRPIVDLWVDEHQEELVDELTKEVRLELINLTNQTVLFDNKKMRMRYAIDKYISSFTSALEKGNPKLLKIPILLNLAAVAEKSGDE